MDFAGPVRVRCPRHQVVLPDIGKRDFASSRHALVHQASAILILVDSTSRLSSSFATSPLSTVAEYTGRPSYLLRVSPERHCRHRSPCLLPSLFRGVWEAERQGLGCGRQSMTGRHGR
eukprot:5106220-Amphidinium_carterae.4